MAVCHRNQGFVPRRPLQAIRTYLRTYVLSVLSLKLLLLAFAISGNAVEPRHYLLSFGLLLGHHCPEFFQSLFHPDALLLKGL